MTYEDGTYRVFWNVGTENLALGESPKRKNTTFTIQLNFGIKKGKFCSLAMPLRCTYIHIFLSLGKDKGEWSASRPSCCTPSKRTSHRHWVGDRLTFRLLMSYIYIYGAHILDVSRSHTTMHHSRYDSSGRVISLSQRPLPDNTRHSQQTNIHAPGGIRTHDLSRRAATGHRGIIPTVVRRCVWSRNIKNRCSVYVYIYICIWH